VGCKLKNVPELTKIIEAGLNKDSVKVLNYSLLLIEKLDKQGEKQTATRIKSIIKKTKKIEMKAMNSSLSIIKPPVDQESRLPLAEMNNPTKEEARLFVNKWLEENIKDYISLINKADDLSKKNINVYRTMLLYGPPGTGKSQTAKYIAYKTNLPLVTVRIDGLVSSYLGNTSKNIRMLFDFVERTPCILFLDEFDAIAKMRDDHYELGELKRVVNTLLQNIDNIKNKIPILAATNHQHLLDKAVWRRFDYKLTFDLPGEEQRYSLLKRFLSNIKVDENILKLLTELTEKMNGAEIETFCEFVITNYLLKKVKKLNENTIFDLFVKYKSEGKNYDDKNKLEDEKILTVKQLRDKNQKFFSYELASKILGCSKSTVYDKFEKLNKEAT
jgi:SpoVK/Ycf46/Vps4 family AAA+-type ATPase